MKHFLSGVLCAMLLLTACGLSLWDRNPKDHSTSEGPALHAESTTLINPELRALAEEVKGDLRNSVSTSTEYIQNDLKPMLWFLLGFLLLQEVRHFTEKLLARRARNGQG